MYPAAARAATTGVVQFTNGKHYVQMLRSVPSPRTRTLTLSLLATATVASLLLYTSFAQAAGPGAASSGGTRISGINTPLALAGLAFLSAGLLVLARSRPRAERAPRLLAASPAVALPLAPKQVAPQPPAAATASLAPLAAVAGALHATAGALEAIATELPQPTGGSVATAAERVREAQITLARWLENRR